MNRKCFSFPLIVSLMLLAGCGTPAPEAGNNQLTLWYKQPAKVWNEALPVGNGRLGAMVFGDPWHERIQINEESILSLIHI